MSLFSLAASIGLEAEQSAPDIRVQSDAIRAISPSENKGFPTIRANREHFKPEFIDNTTPAANDDGLPKHHYKGENLTFWMMPTVSADAMRLKHGDSAWIEAKLRRVPANQRQSLADEYSARYKAAYDAEPDSNKKANKAAFAANSWLLKATK